MSGPTISGGGGAFTAATATARARSGLYGLLAAVLRQPPNQALLRKLRDPSLMEPLAGAGITLERDLGRRTADELVEDLAVEYTRLFVGPGGHIPPNAAVHLGREASSLRGRSTAWVERFIESVGFEYRPEYRDLPDHVGVELEFMRELTAREADALDRNDEAGAARLRTIQKRFLNGHLALWLPVFCDKVMAAAHLSFFKHTAALAKRFVRSECAELGRPEGRP